MTLSIPLADILAFRRLTRAYFAVLEVSLNSRVILLYWIWIQTPAAAILFTVNQILLMRMRLECGMLHKESYWVNSAFLLKRHLLISSLHWAACFTRHHRMASGESMNLIIYSSLSEILMWIQTLMKLLMLSICPGMIWKSCRGKRMLVRKVWSYSLGSDWWSTTSSSSGGTMLRRGPSLKLQIWKPFTSWLKGKEQPPSVLLHNSE